MNTMSEIEQAVRYLSQGQQRLLLDWLAGELNLEMGVSEPTARYGSAAEAREFFTLEEYFEMEEESSVLHEYVGGEIFAMADPSQAHEIIAVNLVGALHAHLKDRPCRIYTAQRRLQFKCLGDDFVYRPDIRVACGETRNAQGDYLDEPSIVIEVLSPSTARIDKREKLLSYREIPSINEYVLVAQKPVHVLIYRRAEQWKPQILDSIEGVLELRSVGLAIPVSRVYNGVP
ncbi:MAG TPA: Uma2 family endonuclease [Steroidobacteraceae bacterium]|jgi:Uma2 family endonuclease|nr:Uma2 family endonuclease [Steroidobacteraceae bacterium]